MLFNVKYLFPIFLSYGFFWLWNLFPCGKHEQSEPRDDKIEALIQEGERLLRDLLARRTFTFGDTVEAYHKRRGMEPPPGFQQWYEFAAKHDVIMVEEFWDLIYEDLMPYRSLPPSFLSGQAALLATQQPHDGLTVGFSIRSGTVLANNCPAENKLCFEKMAMIQSIAGFLPDMDLPVNQHMSVRLVVPWDTTQGMNGDLLSPADGEPWNEQLEEFQGKCRMVSQ